MPDIIQTGVLVLGGGIAGLEAALTAAEAGTEVLLVSKGDAASPAILGFCAPVGADDSPERYAYETLNGGWGLGREELVRTLAEESAQTVAQMEALGQRFDRNPEGGWKLLKPLGCSVPRLVKCDNRTGRESMALIRARLEELPVCFREHTAAMKLTVKEGRVTGAICYDMNKQTWFAVRAGAVVLATGGAHLMRHSTYPLCQTSDGMAMAYEAGAVLRDLEFVQHEPCRCVWPKPLGLSTTLLAKGGILTNRLGERFCLKAYPSEGAVPKDILARLIALEVQDGRGSTHGGVYLDLTGTPVDEITVNHSMYYKRFLDAGLDLTRDIIEVGPAAHSMMGGVEIDADGSTGIPGLYAAGEVIGGLHGANRLGGNAGAEVYVFGRRAGAAAVRFAAEAPCVSKIDPEFPVWDVGKAPYDWEGKKQTVRALLAEALAPVRNGGTLKTAAVTLDAWLSEINAVIPASAEEAFRKTECLHLTQIGLLAVQSASLRTESRGVHYREDYPDRDDLNWKKSIRQSLNNRLEIG